MLWLISGQTYVVLRNKYIFLRKNYVYFKYKALILSSFFSKNIIKHFYFGFFLGFILNKTFFFKIFVKMNQHLFCFPKQHKSGTVPYNKLFFSSF